MEKETFGRGGGWLYCRPIKRKLLFIFPGEVKKKKRKEKYGEKKGEEKECGNGAAVAVGLEERRQKKRKNIRKG